LIVFIDFKIVRGFILLEAHREFPFKIVRGSILIETHREFPLIEEKLHRRTSPRQEYFCF